MNARRLALCFVTMLTVTATAAIPVALAARPDKKPGGGGSGGDVPRQCQRYPAGSPIQQRCIDHFGGSGGGGGAGPKISALRVTPSRFKANPTASAPITTDPAKGAAVTFTLSAQSRVVFKVIAKIPQAGRKVNGKCKAKTRANRNKSKCTLERAAGGFPYDGVAGANAFRFAGYTGRALKPGKYRMEARPINNRTSLAKANFKVTK